MARASGISHGFRILATGLWTAWILNLLLKHDGDCYARTLVRVKEIYQSIRLIKQAIATIPEGEFSVPVKGNPTGEVISRVEQPRGEVLYYLKANGTKNLERLRVRTPTFANIPTLLKCFRGANWQMFLC